MSRTREDRAHLRDLARQAGVYDSVQEEVFRSFPIGISGFWSYIRGRFSAAYDSLIGYRRPKDIELGNIRPPSTPEAE